MGKCRRWRKPTAVFSVSVNDARGMIKRSGAFVNSTLKNVSECD